MCIVLLHSYSKERGRTVEVYKSTNMSILEQLVVHPCMEQVVVHLCMKWLIKAIAQTCLFQLAGHWQCKLLLCHQYRTRLLPGLTLSLKVSELPHWPFVLVFLSVWSLSLDYIKTKSFRKVSPNWTISQGNMRWTLLKVAKGNCFWLEGHKMKACLQSTLRIVLPYLPAQKGELPGNKKEEGKKNYWR